MGEHCAKESGLVEVMVFESCERRLVLSAQLMFDVLGDQALELHIERPTVAHNDSLTLDQHLREAHAATGWNSVQQQFGLTGKGQTVAVIDSGIAWDHVALGQGFGPGYRVVGGWDFAENDARPYDDDPMGFHGTHVSGIIGSSHSVHRGVAPDVDLVALRVFNDFGQGQLSWVEQALQWVYQNRNSFDNPITTVNLSLGTSWNADVVPSWATLEDELQQLFKEGIVVTASAGNSFQQYQSPGLSYPAASPYVIPVASVDDDGRLSDFSQRNSQVIAAPGQNIVSTVPDHVLGRDGKIDDFTAATGTSMAAPYVAGASVLVRQAMEMIGYTDINLHTIDGHLRQTADVVWDSLTNASYYRLNLEQAISSLIPADTVGNTVQTAAELNLSEARLDGWINTLGDQDVYRFTAPSSGTLHWNARSDWLDSLNWSVQNGSGEQLIAGGLENASLPVMAGQTYNLFVSATGQIGSFTFDMRFDADAGGPQIELGQVAYWQQAVAVGTHVRVQAANEGVFSVQWESPGVSSGALIVTSGSNQGVDSLGSNGRLRVDMDVIAGQWVNIQLPNTSGEQGQLTLANVLSRVGSRLTIQGTHGSDQLALDLQDGVKLQLGDVDYAFPRGVVQQLHIDASAGNDSLHVVGSSLSEKVELRPDRSTIENSQIQIVINSVEQITYNSGGGPDRVYLYGSDSDDTLIARPRNAELEGVGYRFAVHDVDRIFVHATGGGQNYAYLYDSPGDDRLSVRPQFSSMSGPGFFNYVRGFERVYAYANAGGVDQADLYDSPGNDRFITSGVSASIVGPGFSSFTRSFEHVNAYATAGGQDVALLYGSSEQTQWQRASDFVSFREDGFSREARGFGDVQAHVAGRPHPLHSQAFGEHDTSSLNLPPKVDACLLASEQTASRQNIITPVLQSVFTAPPTGSHSSVALFGDLPSQLQRDFASSKWPANDETRFDQSLADALEGFHSPVAQQLLPELQVLREADELASWLSERLWVDEPLLGASDLELSLLDEIFSRL